MNTEPDRQPSARAFVVLMGVVALFGDMTYEGARGIVGPYLGLLGASAATVGFAAGFGELLGYGLRLGTGWLAEKSRAYWALTIGGYAVNFVAVPGLALVGHWQAAFALVLLERIGKAVRSPARSTLVSYAARQMGEGKAFGLEEALDQIGAVSGPLITAAALWLTRERGELDRYRAAFAVLLLPVVANLAFVLLARRRFRRPEQFEPEHEPPAKLGGLFRWYVVAASLLALGFADWALLAFHAARTHALGATAIPVLYAAAMGLDALAALAFGALFDRIGLFVLALAAVVSAAFAPLAFLGDGALALCAGAMLWAVGMGAQDSVYKAAVARLVPKEHRGRAYGVFFAIFGAAWWLGSWAMGALYERSLGLLVALSVATQLAAALLFAVVAQKLRSKTA